MAAQTASDPNTSPSSSVIRRFKYDVFLSFRGEDTRRTFSDRLYFALSQRGIHTFSDDVELRRGSSFSTELLNAIEESRCSIVILSERYAASRWCLDALAKIVECKRVMGQKVLPVFYYVDPSEVRKQTGNFWEAFSKHEQASKDITETVQRWRAALSEVTNNSGWRIGERDGFEPKVIEQIVKVVWTTLLQPDLLDLGKLVGIESRVEEINVLLDIESNDVRFIGIWGMGGIGKTAIAKTIFNRICHKFEVFTFLPDIREVRTAHGLLELQMRFLREILKQRNIHVHNVDDGATMIRYIFCKRKVLLILDDVDNLDQLRYLAGSKGWFGSGSRVIISTRNEWLLNRLGVEKIFEVKELSDDESLQLFSFQAFRKDQPEEDYLELSKQVVGYAGGVPLALKVLGSSLMGRSQSIWNSALQTLKESPDSQVYNVLKISFDGLDDVEKIIFLDIACFFKGMDKERVEEILDCFGLYPTIGIQVLIEKSLITILNKKIWMHDLIQAMGREIVRTESFKNPGQRSRLWLFDDIINVLENNTGTNRVEGIALDLPKLEEACWNSEAFSKMHNLRFLQIRNVLTTQGPKYLSNALIFLEWSGFPSNFLPQGFQPEELCELNLCHSSIRLLWKGIKCLDKLKFINVSYSQNLSRTPDFTGTPNLQRLIFEGCTNLAEIHPSIAVLKRLIFLNLKGCRSLESLPIKIELECLETLILSCCSKIKKIPEFAGPMKHLLELSLDETAIEKLPLSIEGLVGLTLLNLRDCKHLECLPSNIRKLKSLKSLNVCGCSKLEKLPESLGQIDCLEELDVGGTSISDLPSSIFRLKNLKVFSLQGCKGPPLESENVHLHNLSMPRKRRCPLGLLLPNIDSGVHSLTELNLSDCNLEEGTIPENLGCLFSLVSLNLSKNNFVSLPKSIRQLSKLHKLNLESCNSLKKLPDLSAKMNFIAGAEGSNSEERLPSCFNFINCFKFVDNQGCNNIAFAMLRRFLQGIPYAGNRFETIIPGSEISEWFSDRSAGHLLNVDLPQHWYKNKWVGYALCAVFVLRRHLPANKPNLLGKWTHGTFSTAHGLRCEVKPKNLGVVGWCPFIGCTGELGQIESDHLWLSFVSGEYFGTAWQDSCRQIEFLFKTLGPGLEVKKCGVRLIYEQDLVEIQQ